MMPQPQVSRRQRWRTIQFASKLGGAMPNYRLVFTNPSERKPIRSINFSARDPGQALLLAQRHNSPAELWVEDKHLCTLRRTGAKGEIWVISGGQSDRRQRPIASS